MEHEENIPDEERDLRKEMQELGSRLITLAEEPRDDAVAVAQDLVRQLCNVTWQAAHDDEYDGEIHKESLQGLNHVIELLEVRDLYPKEQALAVRKVLKHARKELMEFVELTPRVLTRIVNLQAKKRRALSYVVLKSKRSSPEEDRHYYEKALDALICFEEVEDETFKEPFSAAQARKALKEMMREKKWRMIFGTPQKLAHAFFERGWFTPEQMTELMKDWDENGQD